MEVLNIVENKNGFISISNSYVITENNKQIQIAAANKKFLKICKDNGCTWNENFLIEEGVWDSENSGCCISLLWSKIIQD